MNKDKPLLNLESFYLSCQIGLLKISTLENKLFEVKRVNKSSQKISTAFQQKHQIEIAQQKSRKKNTNSEKNQKNTNLHAKLQTNQTKVANQTSKLITSEQQGSQNLLPAALKIKTQLQDYFSSKSQAFNIPLAKRGTDFQRDVWGALANIPYGQTKTYKEISLALGSHNKARAVGQACGKNPFLIVVPCHRVLSQNDLGGFALGLKTKQDLLNLEKFKT